MKNIFLTLALCLVAICTLKSQDLQFVQLLSANSINLPKADSLARLCGKSLLVITNTTTLQQHLGFFAGSSFVHSQLGEVQSFFPDAWINPAIASQATNPQLTADLARRIAKNFVQLEAGLSTYPPGSYWMDSDTPCRKKHANLGSGVHLEEPLPNNGGNLTFCGAPLLLKRR